MPSNFRPALVLFLTYLVISVQGEADEEKIQNLCDDLKTRIHPLVEDAQCSCTDNSADDVLIYKCQRNSMCVENGYNEVIKGKATSIVTLQGLSAPTYSQLITIDLCFDYADTNLYGGQQVCHTTIPDQLGKGSCRIFIGDAIATDSSNVCELCTFCPSRDADFELRSAFDCSNLGYEEARECADDFSNANATVLRFLYDPVVSSKCGGGGAQQRESSSGPTMAPTTSGGVVFWNTLLVSLLFPTGMALWQ